MIYGDSAGQPRRSSRHSRTHALIAGALDRADIDDALDARRWGSAARIIRKGAVRLTGRSCDHSETLMLDPDWRITPALPTSTSSRPPASTTTRHRMCRASGSARSHFAPWSIMAALHGEHPRTSAQPVGDGLADTARPPGQRQFAVESHIIPPPVSDRSVMHLPVGYCTLARSAWPRRVVWSIRARRSGCVRRP